MSAGSISWSPDRAPIEAECPLCGHAGSVPVIVSTPDLQTGRAVDFVRCGSCASVWPVEVTPFPYPSDDSLWDDPTYRFVVHHALELVSGLDRQVMLVESLGLDAGCRVLEVGCNVGVLAAYIADMWDAHVEGVEPSIFGEMARLAFGVHVHREPLTSTLTTVSPQFDAIVAVEVLEHVDDPNTFLAEIRRRLDPDGVALITTPAAESLTAELDDSVALGVLSVGSHNFIYSRQQLEADLRAAGFEHVDVEREGPDLIARVGRPAFPGVDATAVDRRVREFRDRRRPEPHPDPRVELGLTIDRYLAHRRHDPSSGVDIEADLERRLRSVMGIDVRDLTPTIEAVLATTTLVEYGRLVPFRFGEFLYWRGQRDGLSERDRTSLWEASLVVIDHGLRIDTQNLGPLLPALGPPVLALAGRQPGRYRPQVRSAVDTSPNAVVRRLVEPSAWSTALFSLRSRARSVIRR